MYARVFQLLLALLGLMSITIVNASPVVLGVTSNATIADINIPQTWRKANEYKSTDWYVNPAQHISYHQQLTSYAALVP